MSQNLHHTEANYSRVGMFRVLVFFRHGLSFGFLCYLPCGGFAYNALPLQEVAGTMIILLSRHLGRRQTDIPLFIRSG